MTESAAGAAFARADEHARSRGLTIRSSDLERPWGGFLVLDDAQIDAFADAFFPSLVLPQPDVRLPMSPKLLVVAPGHRLSWQYHRRRAELWAVVEGPVGTVTSPRDHEPMPVDLDAGDTIRHEPEVRHRLVGLGNWGLVAEIWEHIDPSSPSDEDDIVRLQDDYRR